MQKIVVVVTGTVHAYLLDVLTLAVYISQCENECVGLWEGKQTQMSKREKAQFGEKSQSENAVARFWLLVEAAHESQQRVEQQVGVLVRQILPGDPSPAFALLGLHQLRLRARLVQSTAHEDGDVVLRLVAVHCDVVRDIRELRLQNVQVRLFLHLSDRAVCPRLVHLQVAARQGELPCAVRALPHTDKDMRRTQRVQDNDADAHPHHRFGRLRRGAGWHALVSATKA